MKILAYALLFCLCSCTDQDSEETFIMPGQFESQDAVWLGWQGFEESYPTSARMIELLSPFIKLKVVCESDSVLGVCKSYLTMAGIDTSNIKFYVMPDNEFWMRDHGATFVTNGNGEMKVVDFEWVTYGYRQWLLDKFENDVKMADSVFNLSAASKRGKVDSLMAVAEGWPIIDSWIKIEGGAIEVNGKGTLLLNEPLTLSRNTGVPKEKIEQEFKRVLGVTNIIWLQHGLAEDPHIWQTIFDKYVGLGTGGHTDEYVRFADANTILLAWVDENEKDLNPLNRMNYERMNINLEILEKARNEEGKPFRIVKVPLPDLITKQIRMVEAGQWDSLYNIPANVFKKSDGWKVGDTAYRVASASYLNFYITNGAVLLPTYVNNGTSPQKEERVRKLFEEAFPGRKLVFMDALPLNWQGGGLHCGTQQQPAFN